MDRKASGEGVERELLSRKSEEQYHQQCLTTWDRFYGNKQMKAWRFVFEMERIGFNNIQEDEEEVKRAAEYFIRALG